MTFAWAEVLPTLAGPRVLLRPLREADADDVWTIFSDADVMQYRDGERMISMHDAARYIAEVQEAFRRRELFEWGIAERGTDRVIGTSTLLHLNPTHRRGELGFALGRAHWNMGLATEAVSTLIAFAFGELGLRRLEADADPRNARSLRLLQRLGFEREGYLRERYVTNGDPQDALMFGLLRSEWQFDNRK